jgi:hypothetical protein
MDSHGDAGACVESDVSLHLGVEETMGLVCLLLWTVDNHNVG